MVAVYVAALNVITLEREPGNHLRDSVLTLFYLSDYSKALWGFPTFFSHSWSLSVEGHFYLLWPLAPGTKRPPFPRERRR